MAQDNFLWDDAPMMSANNFIRTAAIFLGLLWTALCLAGAPAPVYTQEILSKVYTIDRIYKSMQGPQSVDKTRLDDAVDSPELLWITGYRTAIVNPLNTQSLSQDFMCHSNLDMDVSTHRQLFRWQKNISTRLFTLSQGQSTITFPPGFGIPISSDEELSLATQVLNLNIEKPELKVRHKVSIDYVKDRDLAAPMKPLFMTAANGLVLVDGERGFYNVEVPDTALHGPGCMIGAGINGSRHLKDSFGRKFASHWIVKPGREVNKTLVTEWMNLPFDTTVHYIAAHLHPFSESLELRDLTSGETVFKTKVRASVGKIGIEEVDYFSSEQGIALYTDHQYELISVYNNTTDTDKDSMAVMYLYVLDKELMEKGMPDNFAVTADSNRDSTKTGAM